MAHAMLPRLRPYRPSDAPFVRDLGARAFSEYSPRAGTRVPDTADPRTVAIVAELGGAPVGFAVVAFPSGSERRSSRARVASLDAIAVVETERGRGVGGALLRAAEHAARARGARVLRLVTAQANLAALDLFLRSGFDTDERLARYYPRGQDAVTMKKLLR